MDILLNGDTHSIPSGSTVAGLVDFLQLAGRRIAIEVNMEIVPSSQYTNHTLNEGDKVEVVHAIGGG